MLLDLTPTQIEVVSLISEGLRNKEIAHRLGIAEATVKSHVGQAMKRLKTNSRIQLAMWHLKQSTLVGPSECKV